MTLKDMVKIKVKVIHLTPRLKPYNFAIGYFLQNAF